MTSNAHRLPGTVRPRYYDLHIEADPDEDTFQGRATIWIVSDDPSRTFRLHARDMDITGVKIKEGNTIYRGTATLDPDDETATLTFPEKVPAGQARLILEYTGTVDEGMAGLYLSQSGDERCLVTQCEATDARAVFPCFDEPPYKAPIRWTVTTPDPYTVLTNGALDEKTEHDDGTATWRFKATPSISTYLAALAVGTFEPTQQAQRGEVPFRVWAPGGKQSLGTQARDFATELLPWYETYFDVPYPFKKYDQLAVPSFAFGAMENVGLVVFRDSLLLMQDETASWDQRKAIDRVVAHEFAHMWFGNLVTMEWWDDLWLNEAFAEWIAHKAVDELEPTHDAWHDFQKRTAQALDTDALHATHPIYHPVETPEQAMEMFDTITYGKGSAVMRMLEAYLGPEAFRQGLRTYVDTFEKDNAQGQDLWRHLAQASDEPVEDIMQTWITQPGHPTLRVDKQGSTLTLQQHPARASPRQEPREATWPVPIVLRHGDDGTTTRQRTVLDQDTAEVTLDAETDPDWIVPNADAMGFYRSRLSEDLLDSALDHIDQLTPTERARLLHDEWANLKANQRDPESFLKTLDTLTKNAEHHAVLDALTTTLSHLETYLESHASDEALEGLRAWTRERLPQLPSPLEPSPEDDPSEGTRRAILLQATAGIAQDPDAQGLATSLAQRERDDPASTHPDLAGTAVRLNARYGDEATWDKHRALYEERRDQHRSPQEVDRYLHSFPQFRDPTLVEKTLRLLDDGTVPKQDIGPLLAKMLNHPHSQDAAFEHVKANLDTLKRRIGPAWVTRIVEASSQLAPARREEVIGFWRKSLDGLAQEALNRADERMLHRGHVVEQVIPELATRLESHA